MVEARHPRVIAINAGRVVLQIKGIKGSEPLNFEISVEPRSQKFKGSDPLIRFPIPYGTICGFPIWYSFGGSAPCRFFTK